MTDKNGWFVAREKLIPFETGGAKAVNIDGE